MKANNIQFRYETEDHFKKLYWYVLTFDCTENCACKHEAFSNPSYRWQAGILNIDVCHQLKFKREYYKKNDLICHDLVIFNKELHDVISGSV